ncbi:MAG: pyruvate formate-lyase-activating protein [Planctomycetota bacterium]
MVILVDNRSADTPLPQFDAPGGDVDRQRRVDGAPPPADTQTSASNAVDPASPPKLGWVHSHETASTVDGPGFRYVVWLAGCHLRCQYCHNPDTWAVNHGTRRSVEGVVADAARFADFLRTTGGGFTVSGGEPLVQAEFALRLARAVKPRLNLHVALDTNGYLGERLTDDDLDAVDLMLLDLKAFDAERHRRVTGFDNAAILSFAERLARLGRPTWVRYVLVPGLTDDAENLRRLAAFVAPMRNVERVEVLPFHQMGRHKWAELRLPYPLEHTPAASIEQADAARQVFREAGCVVG